MAGVVFEEQAPIVPSAPNRLDIALMVGFVRVRASAALPASMGQWLDERGWTSKRYADHRAQLLDLPIPIDHWDQFDQLFAWERRTSSGRDGSTYLGAAVRSFFAQGGRRCYVVRAGDPLALESTRQYRLDSIPRLLPGYPIHFDPTPTDRQSWSGLGHLFGLPDVSFVCLPDLPEAVSMDRQRVSLPNPPSGPTAVFEECSVQLPTPPADVTVRDVRAPRCSEAGYKDWSTAVNLVTSVLANKRREVVFVAAVPLPESTLNLDGVAADPTEDARGIRASAAFLQLVYPWIRTPGSISLPENLEPADGALTGILARNALVNGTYKTVANTDPGDVADIFPLLSREEQDGLESNVCLFGPTPTGLKVLSDVTMSNAKDYRPGSVSRLVAAVVRTARRIGEHTTFEPLGERAWAAVREHMSAFLLGLFHAGALRGTSPAEAFDVRCDRTTMTQNDLDAGRMIAIVQISPAAPIDTIAVVLVMNEDRQVAMPIAEVGA